MTQLLVDEFSDFFDAINLNATQNERIKKSVSALSDYLSTEYSLNPEDIFLQGSFSTDSAVKPPSKNADGEYDVDIVIICAGQEEDATDVLNDLEKVLLANGVYKDKVETKDRKVPCVRLRYADEDTARFHVDIVPARIAGEIIEIPRRFEGWQESDPKGYIDWVKKQGERYRRTVMILKRWRDENELEIKSVVLQVLVAQYLSESDSDAVNIAETLQNLNNYLHDLQVPLSVSNPSLPDENITDSWTSSDFKSFKEQLAEASDIANSALEEDHDEAATLWQKVLGSSFKFQTDKNVILSDVESRLGDTSHAKPLIYPYRPMPNTEVIIKAAFHILRKKAIKSRRTNLWREINIQPLRYSIKSGSKVSNHGKIEFIANVTGLKNQDYSIHWQVVNTGAEATSASDLRGTFFTSKDSSNPKRNMESSKYIGTHWLECFILLNEVCVARSGRFYITIGS